MELLAQAAQSVLGIRSFFIGLFGPYLSVIELFSFVISLALFVGVCYIILQLIQMIEEMRRSQRPESAKSEPPAKKKTVKIWKTILDRIKAGDEPNRKLAIIEADKTLDELLKFAGYEGDSLGDRLKFINPGQLPNVQDLWTVHKIRNRIVHDTDYHINASDAERAIEIYGVAFRELGLID